MLVFVPPLMPFNAPNRAADDPVLIKVPLLQHLVPLAGAMLAVAACISSLSPGVFKDSLRQLLPPLVTTEKTLIVFSILRPFD